MRSTPTSHLAIPLILALSPVGCAHDGSTTPAMELGERARLVYHLEADRGSGDWDVRVQSVALPEGLVICPPSIGSRAGERFAWFGATRSGEDMAVEWRADGCMTLAGQHLGPFEMRYRVGVEPEVRPAWRAISLSPWASERFMIFPGETLFMEFAERRFSQVLHEIHVRAPANDVVITTLPWDAELGAFAVRDGAALTRSILWLAAPGAVTRSKSGRVHLGLDAELAAALDHVDEEAGCLWEHFTTWVGSEATRQEIAVLVIPAAWDASALGGFARRDGVVLQLGPASATEEPDAVRELLAHELFHRFNGETLRFKDSAYDDTTWFREGVTSYVASVSLVQSGLLREAAFVRQLAEHASNYLHNPARLGRGGELDWERFPYDHGVLLSLALDMVLRDISAGERSLQGFWRFFSSSSWWDDAQDNASLEQAISHYAGVDLSGFFQRYVVGGETLPVHALLHNSGFRVENVQRFVPEYGMSVGYDVDRVELVVGAVEPESVAWEAGVRPGDIVRPVSGTRFDALEIPAEFEVLRGEQRQFIRLKARRRTVSALELTVRRDGARAFRAVLEGEGRCEASGTWQ